MQRRRAHTLGGAAIGCGQDHECIAYLYEVVARRQPQRKPLARGRAHHEARVVERRDDLHRERGGYVEVVLRVIVLIEEALGVVEGEAHEVGRLGHKQEGVHHAKGEAAWRIVPDHAAVERRRRARARGRVAGAHLDELDVISADRAWHEQRGALVDQHEPRRHRPDRKAHHDRQVLLQREGLLGLRTLDKL